MTSSYLAQTTGSITSDRVPAISNAQRRLRRGTASPPTKPLQIAWGKYWMRTVAGWKSLCLFQMEHTRGETGDSTACEYDYAVRLAVRL
jgi:hypothetical protein